MASVFGKIVNRKRDIDAAVDAPEPSVSSYKPEAKKDLGSLPPVQGKKWDDFLGKYVPASEWKSAKEHYEEEDRKKGGV